MVHIHSNDEKLKYKRYNKRITIGDNGNVESHDQKESILNCTIIVNCGAHTVTYDKITKNSFNKNNVANRILTKFLILGLVKKV